MMNSTTTTDRPARKSDPDARRAAKNARERARRAAKRNATPLPTEKVWSGAELEAERRAARVSLVRYAELTGVTTYRVWWTEKGRLDVTADYLDRHRDAMKAVNA